MSWSATIRIPAGTNDTEAVRRVEMYPVPAQYGGNYDAGAHADQVDAAKRAATLLMSEIPFRPSMDLTIQLSGHTCLEGQSFDSISVSACHTVPLPSAQALEASAA